MREHTGDTTHIVCYPRRIRAVRSIGESLSQFALIERGASLVCWQFADVESKASQVLSQERAVDPNIAGEKWFVRR